MTELGTAFGLYLHHPEYFNDYACRRRPVLYVAFTVLLYRRVLPYRDGLFGDAVGNLTLEKIKN